ncbi:unnamed protein product [Urochloa humidicola]
MLRWAPLRPPPRRRRRPRAFLRRRAVPRAVLCRRAIPVPFSTTAAAADWPRPHQPAIGCASPAASPRAATAWPRARSREADEGRHAHQPKQASYVPALLPHTQLLQCRCSFPTRRSRADPMELRRPSKRLHQTLEDHKLEDKSSHQVEMHRNG